MLIAHWRCEAGLEQFLQVCSCIIGHGSLIFSVLLILSHGTGVNRSLLQKWNFFELLLASRQVQTYYVLFNGGLGLQPYCNSFLSIRHCMSVYSCYHGYVNHAIGFDD